MAALAALALLPAAASARAPELRLTVESSRPGHVTGGDALIAIGVPERLDPRTVRVRVNDRRLGPRAFRSAAGNRHRLLGLVKGLRRGRNVVTAKARGGDPASLKLDNHSASGPVFSGPHQEPFVCTTRQAGLGAAVDEDCKAPTKVEWLYRSTAGAFKPLASPRQRPLDLARTTLRDGRTVDYVVRLEAGVINRGIYRWAVLAPGGKPLRGWNGRQIYRFGGGCGAGHQQGANRPGSVLVHRELSRGYSVASSSLTVFGTACNDVLSAETVEMTLEHVTEALGRPPVWTIGSGGSGGSIQAQLIAQDYPGLLDGLLPTQSFPDFALPDYPDCRLLWRYFGSDQGRALSDAQRRSITGLPHPDACRALARNADVVNASEGCNRRIVPPALIFDPVRNPGGARCTYWDSMAAVFGRDPETGYARRTLDNVGVQYGLRALQDGDISRDEFLDLNERIGGYDDNGAVRPRRSVADPAALAAAYRTGRVNQAALGDRPVPIIDVRNYVDRAANVHQYLNTYRYRARLQQALGTTATQVMFRGAGREDFNAMETRALALMGRWLDAIAADDRRVPPLRKLVAAKPARAADSCWINGRRIRGRAAIGARNRCERAFPPHRLPVERAGRPIDSIALKCALRPIDLRDYPPLSAAQEARLRAIFPGGVCDWSRPGIGEEPFRARDRWAEFGR
jgi:hypothetical protein